MRIVCREGRAALVTSFGIFKYMAMYSMTQFTTMCILFWVCIADKSTMACVTLANAMVMVNDNIMCVL
jgi:hypothetical protein